MVLHNPNNWHWVNKDVSGWAREYLDNDLPDVSAEKGGVTAKIDKVISMEGDVDVSQRKGKVITIFDVELKLEYSGTLESFLSCVWGVSSWLADSVGRQECGRRGGQRHHCRPRSCSRHGGRRVCRMFALPNLFCCRILYNYTLLTISTV
jgi:hypothetical protein